MTEKTRFDEEMTQIKEEQGSIKPLTNIIAVLALLMPTLFEVIFNVHG